MYNLLAFPEQINCCFEFGAIKTNNPYDRFVFGNENATLEFVPLTISPSGPASRFLFSAINLSASLRGEYIPFTISGVRGVKSEVVDCCDPISSSEVQNLNTNLPTFYGS